MADLIERQAAIDTVDESLARVFVEHRDIAEKMINKVPSAQPEPCEDAVNRKDVLDGAVMHYSVSGANIAYRNAVPVEYIESLPSAQPERKTGRWIEYDNSHCECPFCHVEWSYFDNEVECFNYCPNCGAMLEGEADG